MKKCLAYELFNASVLIIEMVYLAVMEIHIMLVENQSKEEVTFVQMIENDRALSMHDIEMLSGISKLSVSRILLSKGYRSVVVVWVPTAFHEKTYLSVDRMVRVKAGESRLHFPNPKNTPKNQWFLLRLQLIANFRLTFYFLMKLWMAKDTINS